MRRTKIICTLGPAVDSAEDIAALLRGGMNGARFNFSHGTHESQLKTLQNLRAAERETGLACASILDTKGPEIRIKTFENGPVTLKTGEKFTLCAFDTPGTEHEVSVTHAALPDEITPGTVILIDDGLVSLRADRIADGRIFCTVTNGGRLSNNKSINIPGAQISLPTLTERDVDDLRFGVEQGFDYVAASFVRSALDVRTIRETLRSLGGDGIRIISKIENQQGVDNMDEIIAESDGIMVARGDLGVEIPASRVPYIQRQLVSRCLSAGRLVIIATQMLDSMIEEPRPTRAEVSDVANAVYGLASCVMLSGETASGKYPQESLRVMDEVVREAEKTTDYWGNFSSGRAESFSRGGISSAVTHACCLTALETNAAAIVTATQSGFTAFMTARRRPGCDIAAVTPDGRVFRQMHLVWGVKPLLCAAKDTTDGLLDECRAAVKEAGLAKPGDTIVITAGSPAGRVGSTNLIRAEVLE